jgi:hypothetical protein
MLDKISKYVNKFRFMFDFMFVCLAICVLYAVCFVILASVHGAASQVTDDWTEALCYPEKVAEWKNEDGIVLVDCETKKYRVHQKLGIQKLEN